MGHYTLGHTLAYSHAYSRTPPDIVQLPIHDNTAVWQAKHIIAVCCFKHLLLNLQQHSLSS